MKVGDVDTPTFTSSIYTDGGGVVAPTAPASHNDRKYSNTHSLVVDSGQWNSPEDSMWQSNNIELLRLPHTILALARKVKIRLAGPLNMNMWPFILPLGQSVRWRRYTAFRTASPLSHPSSSLLLELLRSSRAGLEFIS